jgi:hypothetical protein
MLATAYRVALAAVIAVASTSCDSSSPTSASDVQSGAGAPTTPPPTAPINGEVRVTVNPNPVPFSGAPVTDAAGCAGVRNTWFYDHVFEETAGSEVTFRSRIDTFDGVVVNNLSGLTIVVPARGSYTLRTRWCSGNAAEHRAQSSFSGTDANGRAVSISGPTVRLMAP